MCTGESRSHPGPAAASSRPPRRPDPRRALGRCGEEYAARHLERLGFRLLERNFRTRFGEIDVIAFDGSALVFAEVKTRRACKSAVRRGGGACPGPEPLEGLHPRQCARLRRLARSWLSDPAGERPRAETIRFDAIGVVLGPADELLSLEHLEAAW